MEELGLEKVFHLVGDGIVRVICGTGNVSRGIAEGQRTIITCEIRPGFISGGCGGGALPSRDINGLEVLCHLGNLYRIEAKDKWGEYWAFTVSELPLTLHKCGRPSHS